MKGPLQKASSAAKVRENNKDTDENSRLVCSPPVAQETYIFSALALDPCLFSFGQKHKFVPWKVPFYRSLHILHEQIFTHANKPIHVVINMSLAFKHFAKAQKEFKPPLIANENAYLGDVVSSTDSEKPISAGFYRLEKGTPLVYEYHYDEMKIIVEGEFDISDETGQSVHVGCRRVVEKPTSTIS